MTDLPALLARVEAATGPDREIDAAIALAFRLPQQFFGEAIDREFSRKVDGPDYHVDKATWSGMGERYAAPEFTSSLDATVALVEKLRPGPRVVISSPVYPADSWWVKMDDCRAMARTEPLARLAALLRSMIEEEGK